MTTRFQAHRASAWLETGQLQSLLEATSRVVLAWEGIDIPDGWGLTHGDAGLLGG